MDEAVHSAAWTRIHGGLRHEHHGQLDAAGRGHDAVAERAVAELLVERYGIAVGSDDDAPVAGFERTALSVPDEPGRESAARPARMHEDLADARRVGLLRHRDPTRSEERRVG